MNTFGPFVIIRKGESTMRAPERATMPPPLAGDPFEVARQEAELEREGWAVRDATCARCGQLYNSQPVSVRFCSFKCRRCGWREAYLDRAITVQR